VKRESIACGNGDTLELDAADDPENNPAHVETKSKLLKSPLQKVR
jgi:hypothetical protein